MDLTDFQIGNGLTRMTRIQLEEFAMEHLSIAPGLEVEIDIYHPQMDLWRVTPMTLHQFDVDPHGNSTLLAYGSSGEFYVFVFVAYSYLPVPVSIYDLRGLRELIAEFTRDTGWLGLLGDNP